MKKRVLNEAPACLLVGAEVGKRRHFVTICCHSKTSAQQSLKKSVASPRIHLWNTGNIYFPRGHEKVFLDKQIVLSIGIKMYFIIFCQSTAQPNSIFDKIWHIPRLGLPLSLFFFNVILVTISPLPLISTPQPQC